MSLTTVKGMQSEIFVPITPPMVWTPVTKELKDMTIALATAAGVHHKEDKRFNLAGDFTWRKITDQMKSSELMVSHGGYDNGDVNKDINCMFPIDRIHELAKEGFPAIVGPDLTSRNKIEVQNMSFKTAGVLNRAGVMVAITTDHPVSQIQTLPLCAGLAVKAGLPMEEGFRAITIYPAKICGVADRIGSLEVGKDADIAIFDGNPMEIFTRTLYTIINGEIVYCNVPRE